MTKQITVQTLIYIFIFSLLVNISLADTTMDDFRHGYTLSSATDVNVTLNLTAQNAVYSAGLIGNAANFNSTSANRVLYYDGNNNVLTYTEFGNPWTTSGWYYVTNTSTAWANGIWMSIQVNSGSARRNYAIGQSLITTGKLAVAVFDGSVSNYDTSYTIPANTWIHVVTQYASGGYLVVWVNGNLVLNQSRSFASGYNDALIGGFSLSGQEHNNAHYSLWTSGLIDAFYVWNRQLSYAEISALYNNGTGVEYPFSSSVANESQGRSAIISAFNQSALVSSYTYVNDTQAVVRLSNGSQYQSTFDYIVNVGSKRFLLNYDSNASATFASVSNISPVVYVWQNKGLAASAITSSINALINQTLG